MGLEVDAEGLDSAPVALLETALAEAEVIPKELPLSPEPMILHTEDGDVECGLLSKERVPKKLRLQLKGVCGHFHVHGTKVDPGTQPLEELIDHWGLEPSDSSLLEVV